MTVFGWFGWLVVAVINLAAVGWVTTVVLQVLALRRGDLDKGDPGVIPIATEIFERYLEDDDDAGPEDKS